jgi:signal transduction histidine kinase
MHHALTAVDRAVDEALVAPPGKAEQVGLHVTAAVDAASDTIRDAIELNAAEGGRLAVTIEEGHRRAKHIALLLDLLSTLFTGLAAYLTARALAHHARIVEERNQLVARRADELEQFASRVAHDVLGPLSATRLAIGHATSQVSDSNLRRSLERGQRGVERVATIVDGLLRFARAGARPEPGVVTTVGPVVQSAINDLDPVARLANVELTLAPVPSCSVYANAGVLASLVENLTRNAIKYMGDKSERRVGVRVLAGDEAVRLEVRDTGPGIPPSLAETVFDPHVRGRGSGQPGIGLGLATVKRIIESHGGRVGLQSRVDEGSMFWCELPRADAVEALPRGVVGAPRGGQKGARGS